MSNINHTNHIIFDDEKIMISPNLFPVFKFLTEIEEEVNNIFNFQDRLNDIKKDYTDILKFNFFLAKKLKENNIEFKYTLNNDLHLMHEKFVYNSPVRSQMIVLYASLEVLYFLHIAYEKETSDKNKLKEIRTKDDKLLKSFLNTFLLSDNNLYYKENIERFKKITAKDIKGLRNSLTHFFSIPEDGLSIVDSLLNKQTRKLEDLLKQNKSGNVVFLSPQDLNELIKKAHILRVKRWNDDFLNNNKEFNRKIEFVTEIVKNDAVVIIKNKDLKL